MCLCTMLWVLGRCIFHTRPVAVADPAVGRPRLTQPPPLLLESPLSPTRVPPFLRRGRKKKRRNRGEKKRR
jgi:hypothetical protein